MAAIQFCGTTLGELLGTRAVQAGGNSVEMCL